MNVLRMLMTCACLVLGMTVVLAQDQAPPQKGAKGKVRPGEFNAKPAKGEKYTDTLKVGAPAPDFTLADPTGRTQTTLSSFQGKKPVVLILASCT